MADRWPSERHANDQSAFRVLDRPRPREQAVLCQIEALETAIYIAEVAKKAGDSWIDNDLKRFNEDANPGLFRIAQKMATGSGKTVVMGCLSRGRH